MSFHHVVYPLELSYGSGGGPGFSSRLVQLASGSIHATQAWADALRVYEVQQSVTSKADVATLRSFYMARGGSANGFLFKDPSDFTTSTTGRDPITYLDAFIGFGDSVKTAFQLVKEYDPATEYTHRRTIQKPKVGTTRLALDGTETNAFALDVVTGIATFDSPPGIGVAITGGFEFYVPVIFGPEADVLMYVSWERWEQESVSVPLIEKRNNAEPPNVYLYGHSQIDITPGAHVALNGQKAKLYRLEGTPGGGVGWKLPDPSGMPDGGVHFVCSNGTSSSHPIVTQAGATVATVTAGSTAQVFLLKSSAGAYTWLVHS